MNQQNIPRIIKTLTVFCLLSVVKINASERLDTTQVYTIGEVTVSEHYRNSEVRSSTPTQILSSSQISKLNALQLSDAVKHFSGVNVRDYGGVGGLKTISVRSLGASHTAVSYDGVVLSDCQTGQINIGQFSLDQVEMISLQTGQGDNIFQPARMFASASLLSIKTAKPAFEGKNNFTGKVILKGGSFGLVNPAFQLSYLVSQKISAVFGAEVLKTNGRYPYVLNYGNQPDGISSNEVRNNSDVMNIRLEGSLFFKLNEKEKAFLKGYFYQSDRGIPGATIFYNENAFTSQRLNENTFFFQAHYEKDINPQWNFQANARYNRAFMHYVDSAVLNDVGFEESRYYQNEIYGSASLLFKLNRNLSFDWSTDGFVNNMDARFENDALTNSFAGPSRFNFLNVLAARYVSEHITGTASVLSTYVNEWVLTGDAGRDYHKLSPFASLIFKPFSQHDLRFRAFYKHIFRLPSFNDLYFLRVGNTSLKPETTEQYNLGFTYAIQPQQVINQFSVTADVYRNYVKDKIVALPAKNILIWSMVNLGKVQVDGLDLTVESAIQLNDKMMFLAGANYSYQKALDVTTPGSSTWEHQIPYTPRISGSGRLGIETPWANLSYSLVWSGKRYAGYQNYAENRLPGYADHSISLSKALKISRNKCMITLEMNNILNQNYEVVKWFPMPGRSVRGTFSLIF
jgi:hypothetical protein